MGGLGSGRHARFTTTLDDFYAVDLRYMHRQNLLRPGYSGSLRWSRGGQEVGSICFSVGSDDIILSYRTRERGSGMSEDIREVVPLLRTLQRLGGDRLWFGCPRCGQRCAVLYGGPPFLCRRCVGVPYGSQSKGASDRLLRRAQAIRMRLSGSGSLGEPFPPKPKGLHWRTYSRLVDRCAAIEDAMWHAAARRFGLDRNDL